MICAILDVQAQKTSQTGRAKMNTFFVISDSRRIAEQLRSTSGIPARHYPVDPKKCETEEQALKLMGHESH